MHGGVDSFVKLNASAVFADMLAALSVTFPEDGTLNIVPDFNANELPAGLLDMREYVAGP